MANISTFAAAFPAALTNYKHRVNKKFCEGAQGIVARLASTRSTMPGQKTTNRRKRRALIRAKTSFNGRTMQAAVSDNGFAFYDMNVAIGS